MEQTAIDLNVLYKEFGFYRLKLLEIQDANKTYWECESRC